MRVGRETSFLLIMDIQEKLVPAVEQPDRVVANAVGLTTCAWRIPKLTGILACDFSKLEFQQSSVALSGQMRTRTTK